MGRIVITVLRLVIAVALAGSLAVQLVLLPLLWLDMDGAPAWTRVAVVTILALGVMALQACGVCIWRLLTMVRRDTVFSHAAFRYLDVTVGAIAAASVLAFSLAVVAAVTNRTIPGDAVAPGVVALLCGASLVIAGVAMLVRVMRALLVQAVATAAEARDLKTELDGVI